MIFFLVGGYSAGQERTVVQRLALQGTATAKLPFIQSDILPFPYCYAEVPTGYVFFANGFSPMLKWDGLANQVLTVGVTPPATAPVISVGASGGTITGTYTAYARWVDKDGNPSNLSPISNTLIVTNASQISYSGIPLTDDPKVTRLQLLRNTAGQTSVYYVDVDTTDLTGTTFSSSLIDSFLQVQEAVPLFDTEGNSIANRFAVPRDDKPFILMYQGRMFAYGEIEYLDGHAECVFGSTTVTGVGTRWVEAMVGRFFYVVGSPQSYTIDAVDEVAQMLTLHVPFKETSDPFSIYCIRPAPARRRLLEFCCDDKTEALTRRGWLKYSDITTADEMLSINPKTEQIEWSPVSAVNVFDFDGEMSRYRTNRIDALTTGSHRWLMKGIASRGGHWSLLPNKDKFHFSTTQELNEVLDDGRGVHLYLWAGGGKPVNEIIKRVHSDEFVKLVGWYITEGNEVKKCQAVMVAQSISANPQYVEEIRELQIHYRAAGATATECKPRDVKGCKMAAFYFGKGIGNVLKQICPNKTLTPEFLQSLTASQLRLLYDTIMKGDGHVTKVGGTPILNQKKKDAIESFQMLCAMLGMRSNMRHKLTRMTYDRQRWSESWTATVYRSDVAKACRLHRTKERYCGKVWCPTTKNGTWMARRNGVCYWTGNSEAGSFDAWKNTNAIELEENADDGTGLASSDSFLFLLQKRHIYRMTYNESPLFDGGIFLSAERGCINNRSWLKIDSKLYMLDEQGIFEFSAGGEAKPLSLPIQDMFWALTGDTSIRVNWRSQRYFHAQLSQAESTMRWFVSLDGSAKPRHALAYNYLLKLWWMEEYPTEIGSSCLMQQNLVQPIPLVIGQRCKTYAFKGVLDQVTPAGTTRGYVTAATLTTIVDSDASFQASGLVGASVTILDGLGKGQTRMIVSNTGTELTLDQPFIVKPDATSLYQVGGINWFWKGVWSRWVDEDMSNPREIVLIFEPKDGEVMSLRMFRDHRGTAEAWGLARDAVLPEAVSVREGDSDLHVNLSQEAGFARVRMDGRRDTYLNNRDFFVIEMEGTVGENGLRLYAVAMGGSEQVQER